MDEMVTQIITMCERIATLESRVGLLLWINAIVGSLIVKDFIGGLIRFVKNGNGKRGGDENG